MDYKKLILRAAIALCVLSWLAVGGGFLMDAGKETGLILVGIAAVMTEILFWVFAFVFGMSVVQSRQKIFGWIKAKLGMGKKVEETPLDPPS